jgi:hypothetical protein
MCIPSRSPWPMWALWEIEKTWILLYFCTNLVSSILLRAFYISFCVWGTRAAPVILSDSLSCTERSCMGLHTQAHALITSDVRNMSSLCSVLFCTAQTNTTLKSWAYCKKSVFCFVCVTKASGVQVVPDLWLPTIGFQVSSWCCHMVV